MKQHLNEPSTINTTRAATSTGQYQYFEPNGENLQILHVAMERRMAPLKNTDDKMSRTISKDAAPHLSRKARRHAAVLLAAETKRRLRAAASAKAPQGGSAKGA
jgi:hypothetical protein